MGQSVADPSYLRRRAARVRFLAEQISDQRYAALMFDAAKAYESGAIELEAESYRTSSPCASAAE